MRYGSLIFDRAVSFYDRTRALPPELLDPLAETLVQAGGLAPGARVIEPGIGTGRIALPLARRGLRVYGLDLSRPMMLECRGKASGLGGPEPRLCEADVVHMPFSDATCDAVVAIHVFHLIGAWRTALAEVRRVLRPGAAFFSGDEPDTPGSFGERFREIGRAVAEALGIESLRVGASPDEMNAALRAMGGESEVVEIGRTVQHIAPQAFLDEIARRIHSHTWRIPDEVFDAYVAELTARVRAEYGDLDAPLEIPWRLEWNVWRFGKPGRSAQGSGLA